MVAKMIVHQVGQDQIADIQGNHSHARGLNTQAVIQGNQHCDLVFMVMYFHDHLEDCLKGGANL